MANWQRRNGSYRVMFRYAGKRCTFTLGKVSQREAENRTAQADGILFKLEQKYLRLPGQERLAVQVQPPLLALTHRPGASMISVK